MAMPEKIRSMTYSMAAMTIWKRAVSWMPMTEMTVTATPRIVAEMTVPHWLEGLAPKTDRTAGPSGRISLTVARIQPTSMIQPTMNPRYGLIERPTQTYEAPQFCSHRLSRW